MAAPNILNGTSAQCPQVWTHGSYRYGVIITLTDGAIVYKQHLTTLVTTTFDLATIPGNPLSLPIDVPGDGHYGYALCVDGLGKIHIVGNSHSTPLRYVVSNTAEDITDWSEGPYPFSASGSNNHTYNQFAPTPDGTVLWLIDQEETDSDARGRDVLLFKRGPAATSWSPWSGTGEFCQVRTAAEGNPNDGTEADRAYHTGCIVTPDGRTHISYTWRTGNTDATTQKRPGYVYSDDLVVWRNVSGTPVTMPLTWANESAARISSAPAFSVGISRSIAIDSAGGPHILYQVENSSEWVECYAEAGVWTSRPTPGSGTRWSGMFALNEMLYSWRYTMAPVRISIREHDTARTFYIGDQAVAGFDPNPDPVALLGGRFQISIPNGNVQSVWSYGKGPKNFA